MAIVTIDTPGLYSLARNQMCLQLKTDNLFESPNVRHPNFKIVLEVKVKNSLGGFDTITVVRATPDDDGRAYFDLSCILLAYLKDESINFSTIVNTFLLSNNLFVLNDFNAEYAFCYYEEYGRPPTQQTTTVQSDTGFVYLGGVSDESSNQYANNYLGQITIDNSIMTFEPNCKPVCDDQPEFRAWFNYTENDYVDPVLSIDVKYRDGSGNNQTITLVGTVSKGESIVFQTGFEAIIQANFSNLDDIVSWEIYIVDQDDVPISNRYKYIRDCNYYDCKKYFIYLNSLGVPETFRATGRCTRNLELDRQLCVSQNAPKYNRSQKRKFQSGIEAKHIYLVRSGYMSKARVEAAEQLLISCEVAILHTDKDGSRIALPIIVLGKKFKISECWEALNVLEFNFEPSMSLGSYDNITL